MKYSKSKNTVSSELDGEVCLFNSSSGEYLNLNSTGSFIWNLLDKNLNEEDIIKKTEQSFNSENLSIPSEIKEFLNEAVKLGILELIHE